SVAAYARLIPPQTKGPTQTLPVISRVLTAANHRGTGIGKQVMLRAIEECTRRWPKSGILINAQAYLEPFYKSLGFVQISELYDEDGIMHMDMIRKP
ncbi:N-acetyltransferase GCN5, partial [Thraustotheca clavata]